MCSWIRGALQPIILLDKRQQEQLEKISVKSIDKSLRAASRYNFCRFFLIVAFICIAAFVLISIVCLIVDLKHISPQQIYSYYFFKSLS